MTLALMRWPDGCVGSRYTPLTIWRIPVTVTVVLMRWPVSWFSVCAVGHLAYTCGAGIGVICFDRLTVS